MPEDSSGARPIADRIKDGEDLTGADLNNADLSEQELVGAHLHQCQARKANFMKATLRYADFSGADLREAYFIGANLLEANLENADLRGADLYLADLTRARLKGANLESANLESACLQGADLTRTNLRAANLNKANLLDAITLETNYRGASMLETRTIREQEAKRFRIGSWLARESPFVSNLYLLIVTCGVGALFGTWGAVMTGAWWMTGAGFAVGVVVGLGMSYTLEAISTKAPEALFGRHRDFSYSDILYKADLAHATYLYRLERWPEAIEAYREILGKAPDKIEPHFRIARIFHQGLRDPEKARAAYQTIIDHYAQALGENHMYVLESRRGLKELGPK
jgi:hypothetical protein